MGVILKGNTPKAMWPGIKEWFGRSYAEHSPEFQDLYDLDTSDKAWEELVELTGFGLPVEKLENTAVTYDDENQGFDHKLTNVAYGLGYIVSREERDDNQYAVVGKRRAQALAFSMRQGKEVVAATIYNNAFTSGTGGDGQYLCVTTHPTKSGNQSNLLATAADLSEASVEDMSIMVMNMVNSKGLNIALTPQSLHIPPDLYFEAHRLYDSALRPASAENDTNVIRNMGLFPKGIKVNHYFDDTDAFFIRTNCPGAMKWLQRIPLEFGQDNDFDTDNAKYKAYERYVPGWADWRGLVATPGA